MRIDEVRECVAKLSEQVRRAIQWSMEQNGSNDKLNGKNTLIDSHIYEDIQANDVDIDLIEVLIHDYMDYIESGTEAGHWVDEQYLIPWMIDKGIPTDNDTLWKVQWSIYEYGISPRPFFDEGWDKVDDLFEDFADEVIGILLSDIDDVEIKEG